MTNEDLCLRIQAGDLEAREALVEQNLDLPQKIVFSIWAEQTHDLSISRDDLKQEGSLAMLDCAARYDPNRGAKFTTYASAAIRNRMVDCLRRQTAHSPGQVLSFAELEQIEAGPEAEAIMFIFNGTNPERRFCALETHEELISALNRLEQRDLAYLAYRFGFGEDSGHTLAETARHFHLSKSRARATEDLAMDNLWLELPWWYN